MQGKEKLPGEVVKDRFWIDFFGVSWKIILVFKGMLIYNLNMLVRVQGFKAMHLCLENALDPGPVPWSLVTANCWLRVIKTFRLPWYLTLVSADHALSNPGSEK